MKKHEVYLDFIQSSGIGENAIAEICQDGEKLKIAESLRSVNSPLQPIIDGAIQVVIRQRGVRIPTALTHQDLFYSQVKSLNF